MSKDDLINLYKEYISRYGASRVFEYIKIPDFYMALASTRFHPCREGGLCEHSLNVYRRLSDLTKEVSNISKESVAIASLLHDLCTANLYVSAFQNRNKVSTGHSENNSCYKSRHGAMGIQW